jgi:hypothetical protein
MTDTKACPKCQQQMTQGFLFDFGMMRSTVSLWFEGKPEKSLLGGSKMPPADKCLPTVAFRCPECSFLEFYAGKEFAPE